jgi:hypothetical protein
MKKLGSGRNIPDPQYYSNVRRNYFLIVFLSLTYRISWRGCKSYRLTGTTYWYCCWRIEIDDFRCPMPLIVNTNSCFAEHARSWRRALICVAACRCWCPRGLLTTGQGSRSRSHFTFPAVFRIRDSLVRIRIRGPLTSGSGSGSCYFCQ